MSKQRKPQVVWMVKGPSALLHWSASTIRKVAIDRVTSDALTWKDCKAAGWSVVRVELRELK